MNHINSLQNHEIYENFDPQKIIIWESSSSASYDPKKKKKDYGRVYILLDDERNGVYIERMLVPCSFCQTHSSSSETKATSALCQTGR